MSSIYNLEPQPTASCILHTTQGDISLELFAKQTPLTARNFLQHALDGYYDDTVFHRLVPGFILQGGDPTGSGLGGESIYDNGALGGDLEAWPLDQRRGANAGPLGVGFRDEFHSRLKFNRRGLLGMANESRPDTNATQFFFTLDKAPELEGKNTVFGRVAGDTIYNLARMGEAEVEEGKDRPLYPVRITGVEILVNPFKDMVKRERMGARTAEESSRKASAKKKKKKKKKTGKGGKKLLSFGEDNEGEDDEEEGGAPLVKKKEKKKKFDTRIIMDTPEEENEEEMSARPPKKKKKVVKEELPSPTTKDLPLREAVSEHKSQRSHSPIQQDQSPPPKKKTALELANEEIAALKASMRQTLQPSAPAPKPSKKTGLEQFIPETSTRGRKRRRAGAANNGGDSTELSVYQAFKSKLQNAAPATREKDPPRPSSSLPPKPDLDPKSEAEGAPSNQTTAANPEDEAALCDLHFIANCQSCSSWDKAEHQHHNDGDDDSNNENENENENENDDGWLSHALTFAADKLGKDLSYRKKAEEELVVIDPREKARTLKDERRDGGAGAGAGGGGKGKGKGREWDQMRNAELARRSALAGRGAK